MAKAGQHLTGKAHFFDFLLSTKRTRDFTCATHQNLKKGQGKQHTRWIVFHSRQFGSRS